MTTVAEALTAGFRSASGLAGVTVTYETWHADGPGNGTETSLTAIPQDSSFEIERSGEVVEEIKTRDYLILYDDLGSEPAKMDLIHEDSEDYRILSVRGEPQWRWASPQKVLMRIHTVKVEAA